MIFNHFKNFFREQHISRVRLEVQPYYSRPIKTTAADIEIDLTLDQVIPETKQLIEQIVSEFYHQELTCYNYWISISFPGDEVIEHHHCDPGSDAFASAIIYLQADENSGNLNLKDYNFTTTPLSGDLVIFPAGCLHSVTKNNSLDPRICVAFDLKKIINAPPVD